MSLRSAFFPHLKKIFSWRRMALTCWFLPYVSTRQPQVHRRPLLLETPSRLITPLWIVTERQIWAPCAIQQIALDIYFTHSNSRFHPLSPFIPPSPSPTVSASLSSTSASPARMCVCTHTCTHTHVHAHTVSHVRHFCDSLDYSLLGSSVHRIFQARIREWVAMPSSRGSSRPRDQSPISCVSCSAGRFFTCWPISDAALYIGSSVLFF